MFRVCDLFYIELMLEESPDLLYSFLLVVEIDLGDDNGDIFMDVTISAVKTRVYIIVSNGNKAASMARVRCRSRYAKQADSSHFHRHLSLFLLFRKPTDT